MLGPVRPASKLVPRPSPALRERKPAEARQASRGASTSDPATLHACLARLLYHRLRSASAAVIAIILSRGLWFTRYAARHIRQKGERAARGVAGK